MLERLTENFAPLLTCAFFSVLFLQSGLDKVLDRAGNLAWMVPHFEKSPCRGKVPFLLTVLTAIELLAGLSAAIAAIGIVFGWDQALPKYALGIVGVALLSLFAGQRLAKDYAGAASLAAYFAVLLIGLAASR